MRRTVNITRTKLDAGIPLAQSQRQDSGDHRSERAGRQSLRPVQISAILVYLAEKTGKLMPADPIRRLETIQWVFFQMGGIGPMFGQVGFFNKFAGRDIEDKRPLKRYVDRSNACSACSTRGSTAARGSWTAITIRVSHARLGAQPDRLLRSARAGRIRQPQACAGLARPRAGAACGAARPGDPPRGGGSHVASRETSGSSHAAAGSGRGSTISGT